MLSERTTLVVRSSCSERIGNVHFMRNELLHQSLLAQQKHNCNRRHLVCCDCKSFSHHKYRLQGTRLDPTPCSVKKSSSGEQIWDWEREHFFAASMLRCCNSSTTMIFPSQVFLMIQRDLTRSANVLFSSWALVDGWDFFYTARNTATISRKKQRTTYFYDDE